METALDVLSRAATIVQDNANETRLSSKELPTTKWRRDRRLKAGEYHTNITSSSTTVTAGSTSPSGQTHQNVLLQQYHQQQQPQPLPQHHHHHAINSPPAHMPLNMMTTNTIRPFCDLPTTPHHLTHDEYENQIAMETPLDMSVSSTSMKQRSSPPPPYREPLPGSTYASALARPSVITQAPPKRFSHDNSIQIANRETDNCSTESISMCETVIDEHFRRSLGPDYVALFGKKSPAPATTPSPQPRSITSSPPPPSLSGSSPGVQMIIVGQQPPQVPPPAYQLSPQALISPKPSNASSSASTTPLMLVKSAPSSPQIQSIISLPPPQEQPLALQRTPPSVSASNSPQHHVQQLSPHPISSQLTITTSQPSTANSTPQPSPSGVSSSSPRPTSNGTNNFSSIPSPSHQQVLQQHYHHQQQHHLQHNTTHHQQAQSSPTSALTAVPKIMRIKNEPGLPSNSNSNLTNNSSPPSSPLSSSDASGSVTVSTSDAVPSVDDHFAKALGDTWKKLLQENKK